MVSAGRFTFIMDDESGTNSAVSHDGWNNPNDIEVKIAPDEMNGIPSAKEKQALSAADTATENDVKR